MSEFVRIQSTMNIVVTAGLQHKDVTNPDAHIPDRLKVSPTWPKTTVLIKEGVDTYPIEITNWNTVKSLAKHGVITIGQVVEETAPEKVTQAENLDRELENTGKKKRKTKTKLEEIAETTEE